MKTAKLIKPMKAPSKSCHMLLKNGDLSLLQFPLYASYKYDGVRAIIQNGIVYSNNLKPLPNKFIQKVFGGVKSEMNGLDGELIVGNPCAPDCFRKTMSGVMSEEGEPDVRFYVFDDTQEDSRDTEFQDRYIIINDWWDSEGHEPLVIDRARGVNVHVEDVVVMVEQTLINNVEELMVFERDALDQGYEGVMLRSPSALYKEGPARATLKEGQLLKLKRFEDSEFEILELIEAQTNTNAAKKDELGRTKRSSHKDGKVAKGTLGSIRGRDIHTGCEITVATGTLDKEQRAEWWANPAAYIGEVGVYKFFPSGSKDKPRHPTFKGLRAQMDINKKR